MTSIVKAMVGDFQLLTDIGRISYIESHGSSAKTEDIDRYVDEKYNDDIMKGELSDIENIYHIIYYDKQPVGYSKIRFDDLHPSIRPKNITKLERLYLIKEFYGLKLGNELFNFNVQLSKKNSQAGMWLYVWKENHRAINFYEKAGFEIIGSYDFRITATHSNPNHLMFLQY